MNESIRQQIDLDLATYEAMALEGAELQGAILRRQRLLDSLEAEAVVYVNECRAPDGKLTFSNAEVRAAGARRWLEESSMGWLTHSRDQEEGQMRLLIVKAHQETARERVHAIRDLMRYEAAMIAEVKE